jgi:hypothetical protein
MNPPFNPKFFSLTVDTTLRPGFYGIFTPVSWTRWFPSLPGLTPLVGKSAEYMDDSADYDWWNARIFAMRYKGRYSKAMQNYQLQIELDKLYFREQNPHLVP